jgi:ABC-type dipeptide/oligopeptide/nickel transport system ATPase component
LSLDTLENSQISHRIAVMQAGRIVEIGPAERVINSPEHPCTRELLDFRARARSRASGDLTNLLEFERS